MRPYMTFTNRLGQDLYVKLSSEDPPKLLKASDVRVSFVYHETEEPSKLQVHTKLKHTFILNANDYLYANAIEPFSTNTLYISTFLVDPSGRDRMVFSCSNRKGGHHICCFE